MKRRISGPDHNRILAEAQKAFIVIVEKANELIDGRWPPGEDRDMLKGKLWNRVGYMLGKTESKGLEELREEADNQPNHQ